MGCLVCCRVPSIAAALAPAARAGAAAAWQSIVEEVDSSKGAVTAAAAAARAAEPRERRGMQRLLDELWTDIGSKEAHVQWGTTTDSTKKHSGFNGEQGAQRREREGEER